jgi:hypothetical protein
LTQSTNAIERVAMAPTAATKKKPKTKKRVALAPSTGAK